jgi:hypothetical protein
MSAKSLRLAVSFLPLATMCLACLVPEDGDRASTGVCPEGEVCSAATPDGLVFSGRSLDFAGDDDTRIGPVAAGGVIEVAIETPRGERPPEFLALSDDPIVFYVAENDDGFGRRGDLTGDGYAPAFVTLQAGRPGEAFLQIVEPDTGLLFDRTSVAVVDVTDVRVVSLSGPAADALLAGCRAAISIELVGADAAGEVRLIDDGLRVSADGVELALDGYDSATFVPAADASSVTFEIAAAGRRYVRSLPLRSLAEAGLTACPDMEP